MTLLDLEHTLDEALTAMPTFPERDLVMRVLPRLQTMVLQILVASTIVRKPPAPVVPLVDAGRLVRTTEAAKMLGISVALLNSKVSTEPAYKALLVNNGSRIRSYYVDRIERMMAEKIR